MEEGWVVDDVVIGWMLRVVVCGMRDYLQGSDKSDV